MSFGMRCALFAAALLLAITPASAQDNWVTVKSADGSLQYDAPGELKTENYTDVDQGEPYHLTISTSMSQAALVMGMYTEYDNSFVSVDITTAATQFIKELKAQITGFSSKPYRRGPGDVLPGVFVSGTSADVECDLWVIGDGRRNYLLSICSQRGDSQAAVKQRIFDSLKITDVRTNADWTAVTDNGYHFLVPGKPKVDLNRKTGDRTYVGRDGGLLVLGGSTAVPPPPTAELENAVMDAAIQGFVEGNKTVLLSREAKPYQLPSGKTFPGIQFRTKDQLSSCTVRLVLGQGRAYVISACALQGFEVDAKIQRVMDSVVIDEK